MMTDLQKLLLVGVLLNAALYLVAVFTAGLITQNPIAWKAATAAMGFASLGYIAQYHQFSALYYEKGMAALSLASIMPGVVAGFAWLASIVLGVVAGFALLAK